MTTPELIPRLSKKQEICAAFKAQFRWQTAVFVVSRKPGRVPYGIAVRPRGVVVYGPLLEGGPYGAGVNKDEICRPMRPAPWHRFGASRRVSHEEVADFFETLGSALCSGQSTTVALGMAARTVRSPRMRGTIGAITFMLTRGVELHDAMRLFPEVFAPMQVSLTEATAQTGLKEAGGVFIKLAQRMLKQGRLWRKFFSAIAYPLSMFVLAMVVAIILEMVALPPMMALFRTMGAQLPVISQWFYKVALWLRTYAWIIFPALIFGLVAGFGSLPRLLQTRWVQRLVVHLPFVGVIMRQMALARALSTFILLKQSGATTKDMFLLAGAASGNAVVADFFESTYRRVTLGDAIEEAFIAERHQLGPEGDRIAGRMEVGMTGGDLAGLMNGVVDDLVDKAENRVTVLPRLLEWPLLAAIGLVIGMIVLAIFLPYPSLLNDVMQKMAQGR
jgi:type IV pilus assembly protein PilC